MIDKQFVAKVMTFKPIDSEDPFEESVVMEVVEETKGAIQVAVTLNKARHYLTFNLSELQDAVKELKGEANEKD